MCHEASAQVELHRTLWDSLLVPRRFLWKVRPEDAWKLAAEDPDVAPPLVVRRSRRYATLLRKQHPGLLLDFRGLSGQLLAALRFHLQHLQHFVRQSESWLDEQLCFKVFKQPKSI